MNTRNLNKILDYFFLFSTTTLLALGGTGIFRDLIMYIFMANCIAALGYKISLTGKILIPSYFYLYLLFVVTLAIHTVIFKGNFAFLMLFVSGALIWLETYNFYELISEYFLHILTVIAILMSILYFYVLFNPIQLPYLSSLFEPATGTIKHGIIGDFWAIVLPVIFFRFNKKYSLIYIVLFILGIYFLSISFSRSAIISLVVGIFYIFSKSAKNRELKKPLFITLVFGVGLFVYISLFKTALYSRPYYLQSIIGFVEYPLGTGIGNFSKVSNSTNLVHNIVLEVFSGIGIFSAPFIFWLYKIVDRLINGVDISISNGAIFLAVLINFCLITTYIIPAFFWIWFITLALAFGRINNKGLY